MTKQSEGLVQDLATTPTAAGLAGRLALARLESLGSDPAPLLKQCRLSIASLANHRRITVLSQIKFLELASVKTGDDWLGVSLAEEFDLRELGMLYYVAASSDRLGDALRRLERYVRVGNEALVVRIERSSVCRIAMSYVGVPRHIDRQQVEFFSLALLRLCRQIAGQRISPINVRFVHYRTGNKSRLSRLLGCEAEFGAPADEIIFDMRLMDIPCQMADPYLNRLMLRACEDEASSRNSNLSHLRTSVENAVAPLLPHAEVRAKTVARQLGLSERTFARRLSAEGLSFGIILDEMRRDLALRHLEEPRLRISQIAWLLGFRQPSAFSHACRRWTGKTPVDFRRGYARPPVTSA